MDQIRSYYKLVEMRLIGPNWIKLDQDQTETNQIKLNRIGPNWIKTDQIGSSRNKSDEKRKLYCIGLIDLTKGPAAKNDTSENPGCFNQILSFESRKWSPVATF